MPARRPPPPPATSGIALLAGMIGHELLNIAVPLDGFAELALRNSANEPAKSSLDEMRIAIGRIKALASDLGSLADSASPPARHTIGECMPGDTGTAWPVTRSIEWRCSASTRVSVDLAHARRAIEALGEVGTRAAAPSTPLWSVSRGTMPAPCGACGAGPLKGAWVLVHVFNSRPLAAALRDPLGAARVGRASRRLTLAVLVHSAHSCGGHVLSDENSGLISVALPVI